MPHSILSEFDPIFYPRSLAIIGASADSGKFGGRFLSVILRFGFTGKIYPVNPNENDILGMKTFSSVKDIPDDVDLAAICVPASLVPAVLDECVEKGVEGVEILSSGFSETGEEEGIRLEAEVARIAQKGIRVFGPNCFGIYCPASTLTIIPGPDFPKESGPVAFLSQSGNFARRLPWRAKGMGIRFSKVVSFGNAVDVNEADLLEYLTEDPETKVITGYLEGVKDGQRFLKAVQKASQTKPVILWKGGLTKGGERAVRSHTGSLGGQEAVWNGFFRQSGAIPVTSIEGILESALAFLHLPHHCSENVAVVGGGGGISVAAADICERAGVNVPTLPPHLQDQLREIVPAVGTSIRNPVDIGSPYPSPKVLRSTLEALARDSAVDTLIITEICLYTSLAGVVIPEILEAPVNIKREFGKAVVIVLPIEMLGIEDLPMEEMRRKASEYYLASGLPVYTTLARAVRALASLCQHRRWLQSRTGQPSLQYLATGRG